jgi:hypothetical protein
MGKGLHKNTALSAPSTVSFVGLPTAIELRKKSPENSLAKLGESSAFSRFLAVHVNPNTRANYALKWVKCVDWLTSEGISMTFGELVVDDLRYV